MIHITFSLNRTSENGPVHYQSQVILPFRLCIAPESSMHYRDVNSFVRDQQRLYNDDASMISGNDSRYQASNRTESVPRG